MSASARLGAFPLDDGRVEFRVWAPDAASASMRLVPGTCLAPIGRRSELLRDVTAHADEDARIVSVRRGEVELVTDF